MILADICKEYNCKVVIEAAAKNVINEETMEIEEGSWVNNIFELFVSIYKISREATPMIIHQGFLAEGHCSCRLGGGYFFLRESFMRRQSERPMRASGTPGMASVP